MKKKVFTWVAVWHPTKEQEEKGETSLIVSGPNLELATDDKGALILAARKLPKDFDNKINYIEQTEILMRPF